MVVVRADDVWRRWLSHDWIYEESIDPDARSAALELLDLTRDLDLPPRFNTAECHDIVNGTFGRALLFYLLDLWTGDIDVDSSQGWEAESADPMIDEFWDWFFWSLGTESEDAYRHARSSNDWNTWASPFAMALAGSLLLRGAADEPDRGWLLSGMLNALHQEFGIPMDAAEQVFRHAATWTGSFFSLMDWAAPGWDASDGLVR
jgi:hypothetical protein